MYQVLKIWSKFTPFILTLVSIKILTWVLQLQFIWDSCAQIQVYFRLSLSVTHANYLSGLLGYMLRSNTWTLLLHQAGKIIIINHLVNKVKIHARGSKFVSSAIFDQLWTSSIKPLGVVPFFTADSGLLSLDYNSTGKFSTPSCCLWIKQWIFSAVFPRLLNHIQIKSITYHLRTTYYSEVTLFLALILQYKLLSLVQ